MLLDDYSYSFVVVVVAVPNFEMRLMHSSHSLSYSNQYVTETKCADQPCQHGGLCRSEQTSIGFTCDCPPKYVGDACQCKYVVGENYQPS